MEHLIIPTPIAQMFQTNFVPSLMHAEQIYQLRNAHYNELAGINLEVERASALLSKLEYKQNELRVVIGELEALLSPIRRMPTEIIAKVFEHCIHSDEGQPRAIAMEAPLLLAQVCSAWRELLFSHPCLWTSLEIIFPAKSSEWTKFIQNKTMILRLWLLRSKSLPISLTLADFGAPCIPWTSLMLLDQELLTAASRLETLAISLRSSTMSSILTFTQCHLPALRHLELHDSTFFTERQHPAPLILHSAPLLRSFSVSWCSLDLQEFQVPWGQLTELSVLYGAGYQWEPRHSDYIDILAQCRSLVSCSLGIGWVDDAVRSEDNRSVALPHLETLRLHFYKYSSYHQRLLNTLELPKLRELDVQNGKRVMGPYRGQRECFPLIIRSAHTLENLVLDSIDAPDSDVVECLEHASNLRSLRFLCSPMRILRDLIPALTTSPPGGCAAQMSQATCLRMENLHFRCSSGVAVSAIADMVRSRCGGTTAVRGTPCLKKFRLDYAHVDHGPDIRDEKIATLSSLLKDCVEQGLELTLTKSHASGK